MVLATNRGQNYMSEYELKTHLERQYTVVEGSEQLVLTTNVELLMAHGFAPHGGVSVAFNHDGRKVMAQALIRTRKSQPEQNT